MLRTRWKDLGKIDPVSRQRLWKKFDAACSEAYEPCKAHFAKQAEQRQQHLKQRNYICSNLEQLASDTDWSSPDWRQIDKRFQQLRNQWRNTGSVSKKDWQSVYKRFSTAVDAVDKQLQDERRINQNQRQGLIEKLKALAETEDLNDAIWQARDLQKQWQPTVTAKRGDEQKMWNQFRAASDAIFDRKKQKRQADRIENQKLNEVKEDLCAEFEDQILDKNISAGEIAKYEERWRELGHLHDKEGSMLNHRFSKAKTSAKQLLDAKKLAGKKKLIDQMYQRKVVLDHFQENGNQSELKTAWSSLEEIKDKSLSKQFNDAYQLVLAKNTGGSEETTDDLLLLDLEIELELESPAELKKQRMTRQVQRLSNKLSDGNSDNSHQQSNEKFKQYCLTTISRGKTNKSSLERFGKIKTALDQKLTE